MEADCGICGLFTVVQPCGACQECIDKEIKDDERIAHNEWLHTDIN